MRRTLRALLADQRGGVAMLVSGGMVALIGCTAFAVDLGSIYMDSRKLQGIADAAALAAAGNLSNPQQAAQQAVAVNGWDRAVDVQVTTGKYRFDGRVAPESRFVGGASNPDAVRVTLSSRAPVFFAGMLLREDSVAIERTATAARARLASFSIGSRLAAVNGGLVGQYLSQLTGTSINLSVMDYQSLFNAQVDILKFSDALGTEIGAEALTFSDLLDTQVTTPQAMRALADALRLSGEDNAAAAAERVATQLAAQTIRVGDIVDLGPYGASDTVSTSASVQANGYDFMQAMLQLASGERQVALDLGAGIPGLVGAKARIAIGQRPENSPWLAVTDNGETVIRTAQARIYVEAGTPASGLLASTGLASLKLPVMVELASAEARLRDIACGAADGTGRVDVEVRPSIGSASIADYDPATFGRFNVPLSSQPANIAKTLLLSVKGSARVNVGGVSWQSVSFSNADIEAHRAKTVSTNDALAGITASLASDLHITVQTLGLSLPLSPLVPAAIKTQLQTLAAPLDGLLTTLTDIAGVKLGQADVRVNGVRCGRPALVA